MLYVENKILHNSFALSVACKRMRNQGKRVVLTTGAFDVVHKGHVKYMLKAKENGDFLVVGINTDNFIKKLKGEHRPINHEKDRAFVVAAFGFVDAVYIFENRNHIVEHVKPDIFVMSNSSHGKPSDRQEQQDLVKKYGGRVLILDPMSDIHTTDIIRQMKV